MSQKPRRGQLYIQLCSEEKRTACFVSVIFQALGLAFAIKPSPLPLSFKHLASRELKTEQYCYFCIASTLPDIDFLIRGFDK